MLSYHTNKANLSKSKTWMYFLCALLLLHFVLIRIPILSFSLFYVFGIPLLLILFIRFLESPNKFFTKEAIAFLLIFLVFSLYIALINFINNYNVPFWHRQSYKSVLIFLVIVGFAANINQIKKIVKFSIFILIISSLLGLLVFKYGGVFSEISRLFIAGISEEELIETTSLTTAGSHFSGLSANRFYFAYHLCFALFPCIFFIFHTRKVKRLLWFFAIIILILAGLANGQMSLLVSWFFGLMYIIFSLSRRYLKSKIVMFGAFIAVVVIAFAIYFFPTNTITRKISDVKYGYHTSRSGLFLVGLNLFLDNPLGNCVGKPDFWISYTDYFHKFVKEGHIESLHNSFLDPLVRGGIIALFLVIAFFLSLISIIRKQLKIPPEDLFFRNMIIASLIAVLTNSFFHNNGFFIGEGTSFFCLALLCSRGFKKVKYYEKKIRL